MKFKKQKIWSKTSGIRHRMVYKENHRYFIKYKDSKIEIIHIERDLWKIKSGKLYK